MKKNYALLVTFLLAALIFQSCSKDSEYEEVETSPVSVDLTKVPYQKLSDYHFFTGPMKDQKPAMDVVPFEPASSLFADYAHKKRFVWMPKGTKATYVSDDNIFNFPVGSALIKTFYYNNVQPGNVTKIIETRLLVRKSTGWKAFSYIWNNEQTEATLETTDNGVFVPVTWVENGVTKSINYKTPSQTECLTCHKINPTHTAGGEITIPIGVKPQNLNTMYNYSGTSKNQISMWKTAGYLGDDVPATIHSTVNWEDTSKSLELRARSYIDINCAHCHREGGHCDYVAMRFNFSNTDLSTFGVCMTPLFAIDNGPFVINGGDANRSEMVIRVSSTEGAVMMPIIGRSIAHDEGVQLIKDWINSLPANCH
ncbi:hypothetical protein [Flavobacterium humi]|uniref:Cytochrome c domain-containing protein n=1 Tax=Flavobacterium humi TaxID=2562683 RepID=A0A4Z0L319_9FLAO|nr:hypothetical protein [Flavobacterium humi]TGD56724.1 hypothetical protein E4635_14880 [Flavobacterium humi]